jgi:hypothetical protein
LKIKHIIDESGNAQRSRSCYAVDHPDDLIDALAQGSKVRVSARGIIIVCLEVGPQELVQFLLDLSHNQASQADSGQ